MADFLGEVIVIKQNLASLDKPEAVTCVTQPPGMKDWETLLSDRSCRALRLQALLKEPILLFTKERERIRF